MKSVLISIRPEWCEKIASGEKTVEVRKTRPKLEPPFKVYIYQTKNRKHNGPTYSDGKVIGEFVCDWIRREREVAVGLVDIVLEKTSCMSYRQIIRYADGWDLFSWHISDLVIYEKPRQLFDFCKRGALSMDELSDREKLCQYCSDTGYGKYVTYGSPNGPVMCEGRFCDKAYQEYLDENFALTRPPQSWCYVEEVQT